MKQIILLILFVLGGVCFAESDSPNADSAVYADSAAYYESLAARYKNEGEYLLKNSSRQMKIGGALALVGVGCSVFVLKNSKISSSLGSVGVLALTLGASTAGIVIFSINGIREGNARRKIQKSEEFQKKAEEYRENAWKERYRRTSQMMLQVVPEVNPFSKTFGAKLALSI